MKRITNKALTLLAAASLAWFAAGAVQAGEEGTESIAHAKRNYDTYCVQCHGINRNGKGINSRNMSVQPRDHTDAKGMSDIPNDEIVRAIKEGGLAVNKSVLMPAWGGILSDEEIEGMLKYLHQVCNCGSSNQ